MPESSPATTTRPSPRKDVPRVVPWNLDIVFFTILVFEEYMRRRADEVVTKSYGATGENSIEEMAPNSLQ